MVAKIKSNQIKDREKSFVEKIIGLVIFKVLADKNQFDIEKIKFKELDIWFKPAKVRMVKK